MNYTKIALVTTILLSTNSHAIEKYQYLDALSAEANSTNISNIPQKNNKLAPEPSALPTSDFDGDKVSLAITAQLGDALAQIKSGDIAQKDISKALEQMVASALLDGVDMSQLRSVVGSALIDIKKAEALKGTEDSIIDELSDTVDKLLASGKKNKVDSAKTAYLNSISAVVSDAMQNKAEESEKPSPEKETTKPDQVTTLATEQTQDNSTPNNTDTLEEVTVLAGESLYTIALRIYGSGERYLDLYNANKETISNPNLINVGQKLKVPK